MLSFVGPVEIIETSLYADCDDVVDLELNSMHRYIGWISAVLASPENKLRRLRICGGHDNETGGLLDAASLTCVFAALGRDHSLLEELVFSGGSFLSSSSCAYFARALTKLRRLNTLKFVMDVETVACYDLIFQGLASCRSLTALSLHAFDDGEWTLLAMSESSVAMLQNVLDRLHLQHLDLDLNVIPSHLFQLRWPPALRTLWLYCPGDDHEADQFWCRVANSICMSEVTALGLNWGYGRVTIAGFDRFLRILTQSRLEALELTWLAYDVGDDSQEIHPNVCTSMCNFIKNLSSIQELGVGHLAPLCSDHPKVSPVTPAWRQVQQAASDKNVKIGCHAARAHMRILGVRDL
eukprot:TRINITY_DN54274_c0_g1_i1.p1 TRINITY_DN54274_c0_g1~~TRINITY_DN54274_c0_g1_i1.p1  ORF type:complete len:352 (-),score=39.16 TRINITY_DN54274_c0_g1_i1:247-1302(-)